MEVPDAINACLVSIISPTVHPATVQGLEVFNRFAIKLANVSVSLITLANSVLFALQAFISTPNACSVDVILTELEVNENPLMNFLNTYAGKLYFRKILQFGRSMYL